MPRRPLALAAFAFAALASIATSQAGWVVEAYEEGAPMTLSTEYPEAALSVVLQADEVLEESWGELSVSVRVLDLLEDQDSATAMDFVLYEEEANGDREVAAVRGWSLGPVTEEDPTPEVVTLTDSGIGTSGSWRLDVILVDGSEADIEWSARASFNYRGEADYPGDDAVSIDLNPTAD